MQNTLKSHYKGIEYQVYYTSAGALQEISSAYVSYPDNPTFSENARLWKISNDRAAKSSVA